MLAETETITKTAEDVVRKVIVTQVPKGKEEAYAMLVTHVAMAITRVEREEELSAPPEEMMKEVYSSDQLASAKEKVEWVEEQWGQSFPQEEKAFMYMHYVTVLASMINEGDDEE